MTNSLSAKKSIRPTDIDVVGGSEYSSVTRPTTATRKKVQPQSSKHSVNMLRFPSEVAQNGQGHYINFKIHVGEGGKASSVTSGDVKGTTNKLVKNGSVTTTGTPNFKKPRAGVKGTRTFQQMKPPSRQLRTAISLYMPPSIQTSYGATYQDKEIGELAEAVMAGYSTYANSRAGGDGVMGAGGKVFGSMVNSAAGALATKWTKALDTMGVTGIEAMMGITTGQVQTNRMELLFERMERRKFSYTFTFVPTSEQEAIDVQRIVFLFKLHMHPEYSTGYGQFVADFTKWVGDGIAGYKGMGSGTVTASAGKGLQTSAKWMKENAGKTGGRVFRIPDTFDIEYMYASNGSGSTANTSGEMNNFIHKISTCHLTNMNVTYGGDKFRAYDITTGIFGEGSPPQNITMSLDFQEIEILTKESIAHNY